MAQWLGRQSLASILSLIYAWIMVDMWPLCGQCPLWVDQPGQLAFQPFRVGKYVRICVITWIMGVYTINSRPGLHMTVHHRSKTRGRRLSAVCDVQRRCSCCLWCCISVMPLPFTFTLFNAQALWFLLNIFAVNLCQPFSPRINAPACCPKRYPNC